MKQLPVGEIVSEHLNQTGASTMFRVMVGNPLGIEIDGSPGVDFDLYVRKGAEPTINDYDYRGYTSSPDERIRIQPAGAGEYFVMVHSYRGAGDFKLKASLV